MKHPFVATAQVTIHAPLTTVWNALIDPAMIKQYLFGTQAISDWKVGSSIAYKGEWEGKTYEDKGVILALEPEKLLKSTYWSSFSGTADSPEIYNTVTYALSSDGDQTILTITQDNIVDEAKRNHSQGNWTMVLHTLKKLLET